MLRIVIADDHRLFAEGLADALNSVPDMRVVGVVGDGNELAGFLERQPADVVLLDLEMPGGGMEALRRLPAGVPALMVTMHATPEVYRDAVKRGAQGVLSKSVPLAMLAAAVRAAADGKTLPWSATELEAELAVYSSPKLDPGAAALTAREIEILELLARGISSTEELAERLYISQKTVKNHLASIFQKLSVSDRTQAAIEAIRLGIAKPK
ncbi:MAG: DNA-binding response regulator [Acidimicrobiia bacterium]|nr:MAG: DNA-binding response regulator [Acidimicrobiia bacterium]